MGKKHENVFPTLIIVIIIIIINIIIIIIFIIIITIIIIMIELTNSKTLRENAVEIEPKAVALDFKNLSQYSSRSVPSKAVF